MIETYRRRHLAYLMADQGTLVGNPEAISNLPKQHLVRRQVKKSKSMIQMLLFNKAYSEDDLKCKNIKQTEILVDMREAIMQVYVLPPRKPDNVVINNLVFTDSETFYGN